MIREGRVFISVATDPDFGASYSVQALEVGAQVTSGSSGTTATVRAGHGFSANDKFIVGTDTTKYNTVTVAGATSLTITAMSLSAGDILVNLGPDTGVASPNWDGNGLSIYTDMDYTTLATNRTVTTDSEGRYRYFHKGIAIWELVRTGSTPIAYYLDAGISAASGPDSSTDNAVARWDGTTGETLQSGVVLISDAGAVTGVTTLAMGGALSGVTTLNASGLVAAAADLTVGTTLGVTGITTTTGGVSGGIPRNCGTWQPPTATPGAYKQPVTTEMYVGSVFVPANMTITGIKYLIGTATPAAQKITVSLFNAAGTKVANSTTSGTAMTTSPSVTQSVQFTGTYAAVGPGWHFIGLMFDTATANLFSVVPTGADAGNGVVGSIVTGLTALTPPSSITAPITFTASGTPIASLY